MYRLNLFYEQQRMQRERDLDPVRLTILGGLVLVLGIVGYWSLLYYGMRDLRRDLDANRKTLAGLDAKFKELGTLTDLARIQSQAQILEERMERRTPIATQLDILRNLIPTNCQVRLLKTQRGLQVSETTIESRKGSVVIKKAAPTLGILLEIESRGKDKVEVLQTRDQLSETLRRAERLREWIVQVPIEGETNTVNRVDLLSSQTPDAARGQAMGVFEFRLPVALKEPPIQIP